MAKPRSSKSQMEMLRLVHNLAPVLSLQKEQQDAHLAEHVAVSQDALHDFRPGSLVADGVFPDTLLVWLAIVCAWLLPPVDCLGRFVPESSAAWPTLHRGVLQNNVAAPVPGAKRCCTTRQWKHDSS